MKDLYYCSLGRKGLTEMLETLVTGVVVFASTNIDDIFLLAIFFGNKKLRTSEIVTGQYLGIGALIIISLIGSLLGLVIDTAYIGLLSFIPIYLGIKGLLKLRSNQQHETELTTPNKNSNVLTIASVTFANGGDNIGIYIPLFSSQTYFQKGAMVFIFLFMVAVWCVVANYLTKHPKVASIIDNYGHIITPFVLIAIGLFIFKENNTIKLLTGE